VRTVLTGLAFGESPRWHAGRLWYSDMGTNQVVALDPDGSTEVIATVPGMAMGTGWLPDGRMLIVSCRDGVLLRREPDGALVPHADLARLSRYPWGDMVVDGRGNAYVGCLGFDFPAGEFAPGILALVRPDGTVRQVADGLAFPNGLAVTPDLSTLIVAESYTGRLTAYTIEPDGTLAHQRVWADLGDAAPDGICLDADGAVWYADVPHRRCVRVREGGEVLATVELDRGGFACVLGGPDRRTLYVMAAEFPGAPGGARTGEVRAIDAPSPGAGWP
jgi:sugar lactone lactonase YvrE